MGAKQRLGDLRRAHPITALVLAFLGALGLGAGVVRLATRARQAWIDSQGNSWIFVLRLLGRDKSKQD
jgi:hypothetical protein